MQWCPTGVSLKFLFKSLSLRLKCVGEKPSIKVMALFGHFLPTHTPNLTWHCSVSMKKDRVLQRSSFPEAPYFVFGGFSLGGEYLGGHFLVWLRGHSCGFFCIIIDYKYSIGFTLQFFITISSTCTTPSPLYHLIDSVQLTSFQVLLPLAICYSWTTCLYIPTHGRGHSFPVPLLLTYLTSAFYSRSSSKLHQFICSYSQVLCTSTTVSLSGQLFLDT